MTATTEPTEPAAPRGKARAVLEGLHLVKEYPVGPRRGLLRPQRRMRAVDDVSVSLARGRVTALVGQSGSGKSTLGRMLARLVPTTSGAIRLDGRDVTAPGSIGQRTYVGDVQFTLQDPFASLNPLRRVDYILGRAVRIHQDARGDEAARDRCRQLLERVGLTATDRYLDRFPHELSGGERQRVSFARALAASPKVLIADEPVSMLDVTIRGEMLDLIDALRRDEDLAVLYITHDLGSARRYSNEVLVMNEGRIVESGESTEVIDDPQHEYTRRLLAAAPNPTSRMG
ncbi:ABC transporter ATP-binding protein [Brachybacterium sacelli]|uniref:Peptide/nickel transport system ATP-binding protein n=1 Tax=Brachybacterium sacelli TaxID=173364 RepID=A0ABS4WYB6_9MICO|nr:ATP-binding cassette domain-containing protein [Brachybacterium sacelli]MBP2380514.1 peptide/nickel transport system ATP-binding protein [Brachybacterium sacelli]